jgi:hypothetical protein
MHVFSTTYTTGREYVPTLYKLGFIAETATSGKVTFRPIDLSLYPINGEAQMIKATDNLKTGDFKALVLYNELALVYGLSHEEWSKFIDEINKHTQGIQEYTRC